MGYPKVLSKKHDFLVSWKIHKTFCIFISISNGYCLYFTPIKVIFFTFFIKPKLEEPTIHNTLESYHPFFSLLFYFCYFHIPKYNPPPTPSTFCWVLDIPRVYLVKEYIFRSIYINWRALKSLWSLLFLLHNCLQKLKSRNLSYDNYSSKQNTPTSRYSLCYL